MILRPVKKRGDGPLVEALCHVLGNTCRLSRAAKSFEWNVEGMDAESASRVFRNQADEMHAAMDVIAGHIRGLGAPALLNYSDSVVELDPPADGPLPALPRMVAEMASAHAQALISIWAAMDVAGDRDAMPTSILLAARIEAHRDHARHLRMLG